jgi:predicted membrane GTPase involved in stress response
MKSKALKQKTYNWAQAIGMNKAIARLIERNVGVRTASRLARNQYDSEPRGMLASILMEEMRKDGFVLSDEAV